MNFKDRILHTNLEGKEKTCIRLGSDEFSVPLHLMTGEKQKGYIYSNGALEPWYWDGLCTIEHNRYVYFDHLDIKPITEIRTAYRKDALDIVRNIAIALSLTDKNFLDLQVGLIPLWRFFIIDEDSVLILPPDLSNLFAVFFEDKERYHYSGAFAKGGTEENFAFLRELGELLYMALTGRAPYEEKKIRDFGYKELPLELFDSLFSSLDEKTKGFINFTLHAKSREQRDIMGNTQDGKNLSWFIKNTASLSWNVADLTEEEIMANDAKLEASEVYKNHWKKIEEGAKRNNFWRKRGTLIITITIATLLIGGFLFSYISNLLEPPSTVGLDEIGVIESFYNAQSNLDVTGLQESLKGVSAPQETEVINLYVTTQTRKAYERLEVMRADEWVDNGKPAINSNVFIYGLDDLVITKTGENQFHAEFTFYSPYSYEDDKELKPEELTGMPIYVYKESQDFTTAWNDRGWWNIVDITNPTVEFIEVIQIPVITTSETQASI